MKSLHYKELHLTPGTARNPSLWPYLALLWLSGNALRLTVLAVPPVLPAIHQDLRLDETLVGALTALPVLLLSAGAVFGSLLVARLGARRALLVGLALIAVAGGLRGAGSTTVVLFVMTFVMGAGVAVSQPALPSLVKLWLPDRSSLATGAYANGILVGEILAAALTTPLILPLVGNRWQLVFVFWSSVIVLIGLAVFGLSGHEAREPGAAVVQWWPDWWSGRTWRLGLVLGCASLAYFGANAFVPDYLKSDHHSGLISAALTSLNLSQLPSSFLVAGFSTQLVGRRWPIVGAGVVTLLSAIGFRLGGGWVVFFAGTLGFSTAMVLVLTLALLPLLAGPDEVHHLTAGIFTITYACPFVGSLLSGAIWDLTGVPFTAFVPLAASGVAMMLLAQGLNVRHQFSSLR